MASLTVASAGTCESASIPLSRTETEANDEAKCTVPLQAVPSRLNLAAVLEDLIPFLDSNATNGPLEDTMGMGGRSPTAVAAGIRRRSSSAVAPLAALGLGHARVMYLPPDSSPISSTRSSVWPDGAGDAVAQDTWRTLQFEPAPAPDATSSAAASIDLALIGLLRLVGRFQSLFDANSEEGPAAAAGPTDETPNEAVAPASASGASASSGRNETNAHSMEGQPPRSASLASRRGSLWRPVSRYLPQSRHSVDLDGVACGRGQDGAPDLSGGLATAGGAAPRASRASLSAASFRPSGSGWVPPQQQQQQGPASVDVTLSRDDVALMTSLIETLAAGWTYSLVGATAPHSSASSAAPDARMMSRYPLLFSRDLESRGVASSLGPSTPPAAASPDVEPPRHPGHPDPAFKAPSGRNLSRPVNSAPLVRRSQQAGVDPTSIAVATGAAGAGGLPDPWAPSAGGETAPLPPAGPGVASGWTTAVLSVTGGPQAVAADNTTGTQGGGTSSGRTRVPTAGSGSDSSSSTRPPSAPPALAVSTAAAAAAVASTASAASATGLLLSPAAAAAAPIAGRTTLHARRRSKFDARDELERRFADHPLIFDDTTREYVHSLVSPSTSNTMVMGRARVQQLNSKVQAIAALAAAATQLAARKAAASSTTSAASGTAGAVNVPAAAQQQQKAARAVEELDTATPGAAVRVAASLGVAVPTSSESQAHAAAPQAVARVSASAADTGSHHVTTVATSGARPNTLPLPPLQPSGDLLGPSLPSSHGAVVPLTTLPSLSELTRWSFDVNGLQGLFAASPETGVNALHPVEGAAFCYDNDSAAYGNPVLAPWNPVSILVQTVERATTSCHSPLGSTLAPILTGTSPLPSPATDTTRLAPPASPIGAAVGTGVGTSAAVDNTAGTTDRAVLRGVSAPGLLTGDTGRSSSPHQPLLTSLSAASPAAVADALFPPGGAHPSARALVFVSVAALELLGVLDDLHLHRPTVARFFARIGAGYGAHLTYHTALHAADVTQAMLSLMVEGGLARGLGPEQRLAAILAAACHDVGHPGVNNVFLSCSGHPLALAYNDSSPLEQMHAATAFLVMREPGCNIMGPLGEEARTRVRRLIIALVLSTDNSGHFRLLARLRRRTAAAIRSQQRTAAGARAGERGAASQRLGGSFFVKQPQGGERAVVTASADIPPPAAVPGRGSPEAEGKEPEGDEDEGGLFGYSSDEEEEEEGEGEERHAAGSPAPSPGRPSLIDLRRRADASLLLRCALHACDISNPCRAFSVYELWTDRITEEFLAQGDLMRELHMLVPPTHDRAAPVSRAKLQAGFVTALVQPLWESLGSPALRGVLSVEEPLQHLRENLGVYTRELEDTRPAAAVEG